MSATPPEDRVELRPPPNQLNIQFAQSWGIVTPAVFRYEDSQWIDEFFESGKLRLSTFSKFATYPDEIRGDSNEGKGICYGETQDNKSVFVVQAQGVTAAVLCCSHKLDSSLRESFGRNSAFEITNTLGFASEISRQLPGFRHGIEGSCIYRSAGIRRPININLEKYKLSNGNIDMQMAPDLGSALGGPELLLLKRKSYEAQQEYRLIWELDSISSDYIDVVAPNARQYCRRVKLDQWSS